MIGYKYSQKGNVHIMSKQKGHCQACLRQQAVNDKTGRMSLHGYRVAGYGYFSGTCNGSKELPLEKDTAILDREVVNLRKEAKKLINGALASVYQVPVTVNRKTVLMNREDYARHHEERGIYGEADEAFDWMAKKTLKAMKAEGEYMMRFANDLVYNRDKIHGQDLIDVEVVSKPVYETKVKRFTFEASDLTTHALLDNPDRKRAFSAAQEFIRSLYNDETVKTKGVRRDSGHLQIKGPTKLKRYGQDEWDGKTLSYKVSYEKLK